MSTIQNLFEQAQLAEAAYANFLSALSTKDALIANKFSTAQAADFVAHWTVVDQSTPLGVAGNGFSATLFQSKDNPGQYTLAIAGTTLLSLADWGAVGSLAVGGAALEQLVSLVNYVLRLKAGSNGTTQQVAIPSSTTNTQPYFTTTQVSGIGPGIAPAQLTIAGHSLGGALGQMYQRVFGSAGVNTFNSVGISNTTAPIFDQLTSLLGLLPGSFSSGSGQNLVVPGDPAQLIGTVQGTPQIAIFTETANQNPDSAHSISAVTDSLALYNLFAKLDPTLNTATNGIQTITAILKACSNVADRSLENALDSLRTLFNAPGAGTLTATDNRDQLYKNLTDLQTAINCFSGPFTLRDLSAFSAAQIASIAQSSIAYRYALLNLTPFALVGNDAVYGQHNTQGELDLYDPATSTGTLSQEWLTDRAAMLAWKNKLATEDYVASAGNPYQNGPDAYFKDVKSGEKIYLGNPAMGQMGRRFIIFGDDQSQPINGSSQNDRLYGMRGNDTLNGGGGNDYIEGGAGNDTYFINTGDGTDTIEDKEGTNNKVIINGKVLNFFYTQADGTYISPDAAFTAKMIGTDLWVTEIATNTQVILNKDFQSGDFGITLMDAPTDPVTTKTIMGDINPTDYWPDYPGIQVRRDPNTFTFYGTAQPYEDIIIGSDEASDHVLSGELNDDVFVGNGNDWVEAGNGNDFVYGGDGNDLIEGGAGADVLAGGFGGHNGLEDVGNDRIYGGIETSTADAIAHGNTDAATGLKGDWLSGNGGDDTLVAGASNDALSGGGGNDLIIAGAGDDFIWGDADYTPEWITESTPRLYLLNYDYRFYTGDGLPLCHTTSAPFNWAYTLQSGLGSTDGTTTYNATSNPADSGNDVIYAGAGDDVAWGGAGDDIIMGEAGDDYISGDNGPDEAGNDYIDGGDGYDTLFGGNGTDTLFGGADDDFLGGDNGDGLGAEGDDYLDGEDGNDELRGNGGKDTLFGGAGDDTLRGDNGDGTGAQGDDYLDGEDGNDTLSGEGGNDALFGGNGNDFLVGGTGDDYLSGEAGVDRLQGGAGNDMLLGGDDNDILIGEDGDDTLDGEAGDDNLDGLAGLDTLSGGAGNDTLRGGDGNDTLDGGDGNNVLYGEAGNDVLSGGAGDDSLYGGAGDDTLNGGGGYDDLGGGDGNDIYVLSDQGPSTTGIAHTTISDTSGNNTIQFSDGTAASSLVFQTVQGSNTDFILQYGLGDQVYIENGLTNAVISNLNFSNGQVLTQADIMALAPALNISGGAGNDNLMGGTKADIISGGAGNDILQGGAGNDQLSGGTGNDTYVFNRGDEQDTIDNTDASTGHNDTLLLGAGIATTDVTLKRSAYNLIIAINNTADQVTVLNYFSNSPINRIQFSDLASTVWTQADIDDHVTSVTLTNGNDGFTGTNANEIIWSLDGDDYVEGMGGDDSIDGGAGADNLHGDDGNDTLDGGTGNDTLFGGAGNDVYLFNRDGGHDQIFTYDITPGKIDTVRFGVGIAPSDVTFCYTTDYTDTGLLTSYSYPDNSLILGIKGTTDQLVIENWNISDYGIERVEFADDPNTVWDAAELAALAAEKHGQGRLISGDSGNNVLMGDTKDNIFYGGAGNDWFIALNGTQNTSTGNDLYLINLGDGQDIITDQDPTVGNVDTIRYGAGIAASDIIFSRNQNDLVLGIKNTTDQVTIQNWQWGNVQGGDTYIERVEFADGTAWNLAEILAHIPSATFVGTTGDDTLSAWNGQGDVLQGLGGNDLLYGANGNDTLDGGAGNDNLYGAVGNDTYLFNSGSGQDVINDYDPTAGNVDTIRFGTGIVASNITFVRRGYDLVLGISGTTDQLTISNWSLGSNSYIEKVMFADGTSWDAAYLQARALSAPMVGTSGNDYLAAWWTDQGEVIQGLGGNDTISGWNGNDTLDGGVGADTMYGHLGDDMFVVDNTSDVVIEYANEGTDTVQSSVTYTLGANVENLTLTGTTAINGTGNSLNNILTGNSLANSLTGGAGDDTYVIGTGDTVVEAAGAGTDTVQSSITYTLGNNVENLTLTGTAAINGTGNSLTNILIGNSLNNSLSGGTGADTMMGGLGDDTYTVDNTGDIVTENLNEGTDLVNSSVTYTLSANVENLTLTGTTAINGTGNTLNNVLTGNSATNTLTGGAGDDTYVIGTGDTVVEAAGAGTDTVQSNITYTLGANVENLTLTGTTAINGTGNTLNNVLTGNSATNTLTGGAGDDTYVIGTGDIVVEAAGAGTDTVQSNITYTLGSNVENLTLTGTTAINGTGNTLNNVLTGNSATNTLTGGAGDDTYVIGTGDTVVEAAGAGTDTVQSSVTYTLAANVENLTLTGSTAINGTGNTANNVLTGNSAVNTLTGGAGDDTYVISTGDIVVEAAGAGTDTVQSDVSYTLAANVENLTLTGAAAINGTGNSLANTITGNSGANTLTGGAGVDTLAGGAGDDTYQFLLNDGADTIAESSGNDQIVFGAGILNSSVTASRVGSTVKLAVSASDNLSFAETAPGQYAIEQVVFADGTVWQAADLTRKLNSAPTGAVSITGTATEGQTLTAANTLADADGLGAIGYQWKANGVNIAGATGSTYLLTAAEGGKIITVAASYIDGHGTAESVASNATAAVVILNNAPTGAVTLTGTATQNQILTATNNLADADGLGTIGYQWQSSTDGATWTNIAGATANTYTLAEAQVGKQVRVNASYTDGHGTAESVASSATAAIVNVNEAPTGAVTITGTATQNQILTASVSTLADTDGLGTIGYQWKANGANINGATGSTLTLAEAQVGKTITVSASYTDGHGTAESVTSSTTATVANVNDAPTGTVIITGTATEGQTLTLSNTLADADGLGVIGYQWKANGANISGATGSTYLLTAAQVGKTITVAASYTDGHGTAESVSSSATAAVAHLNIAPTGNVTITGNATQNQTLTASNNLADTDGLGTIGYQWQSSTDGATWTNITGATASTFTITEAQVGKQVRTNASYTDGYGTAESVNSTATTAVANVNDAPTGSVSVSGTATQNQTLAAVSTLADADGLGAIGYQWQSSTDGSTWSNIVGATTGTYTLAEAQVGKQVRVKASYTDGHGTAESVNSSATTAVVNVNDAPTGSVTGSGTATQNQTLTAANTLADVDGLGVIAYQWQSSADGATWANIAGATANTYTLVEAQVGKQVRVKASYTDGHGTTESMNSSATAAVANVNDVSTGNVTVSGTATQNQTLTAANTLADADGLGAIGYQWQTSTDGTMWTNIAGATASTFSLTEAQVGKQVRVNASYTDGHGTAESVNSSATAAIANVNDAPTGAVTVSGGAVINQTLTAANTLADVDGLGAIAYQWQSSTDGATWTSITGATANTFTLTQTQVGQQVRANASYIDGHGTAESVSSSATAAVASVSVFNGTTGNDTLTGTLYDDILYGLAGNDSLTGLAGNDMLDGGAGTDTMSGGLGNDTYAVDSSTDVVTENANEGTDTVQSSITYTLGNNVENLTLTGTATINGTGNTLNNILIGNTANNTLSGGTNADTMMGGLGNDTYTVDNAGDIVTENLNEGTDLVNSSVTYTLSINVENLTLTGTTAINGTGNALDNILTGNSAINTLTGGDGNDTLNGAAGADKLLGGLGNDNYVLDNTGDVITENLNEGTDAVNSSVTYTLSANVENLTLTGTTAINGTGNALDNILTGNSAINTLTGGAGNDTLNGAAGADKLLGGLGNDTYVVDNTGDVITENLNEGIDSVQSSVTCTLATNVENLTLTGTTAINGTGNALDNILTGNSAANVLTGGAGNDTYYVGTGDTVTETANNGTDTVVSNITYTLGSNLENLTLTGTTAINGTGNSLNNILTGNSLANSLTGGAGDDTYVISTGDTVVEAAGAGTDTVQSDVTYTLAANVENLTLTGTTAINGTGNSLNNTITGNSGANALTGGAGVDTLAGGAGDDTYQFLLGDGADTIVESSGNDQIVFGAGILTSSVTASRVGGLVKLAVSASDNLSFAEIAPGQYAVEQVVFAGGTIWQAADLTQMLNSAPTGTLTITGTATEGQTLTAANTLADADGLGAIGYQWKANGVNIAGATGSTYLLTAAEGGKIITVAASYIDGHGTAESVASNATAAVAILNNAPTGAVTLTGAATQNQILTATNNLADADGLGTVGYQWQSSTDGATWTNITGATANTFSLAEAQVGKQVRAVASYTDGHGTAESVASSVTAAVANVNDALTGSVTLTGTATQNQTFTATNTLADADGLGAIGYQWQSSTDGTTWTNIVGATANTYTLAEAQVGKQVRVKASYTDGHGTAESMNSSATAAIANVNDALTGSVTFTGTATQNQILTATNNLADADGLGVIGYQWQSSIDGATWANITGATASTYTLAEAQVGKLVRVNASYTDGHGTAESMNSSATAVISNVNDAPTGTVTVSGTATEGQTLTVSNALADADGLGAIGYQWKANGANISGAIGNTYLLTATEVGQTITVVASYTDGHGTAESMSSSATVAVAPISNNTIVGTAGDDNLLGTVGNDTINGLGGNDTLNGGDGNDILDGGAGIDTLWGKAGNDIYLFGRGYGQDTILDSGGSADAVLLAADILPSEVALVRDNNDLVLTINNSTTDKLTLQNWFYFDGSYRVEEMRFANGTLWNAAYLAATPSNPNGTEGNDWLYGSDGNADIIYGNGGNDTVYGYAGNDFLNGGAGSDTLDGGLGNDILQGGAGSDTFSYSSGANLQDGGADVDMLNGTQSNEMFVGGTGNDTISTGNGYDIIAFNRGDGQDILNGGVGTDNTLSLGGGIQYSDLALSKVGNDLILEVGNSEQITLKDWYASTSYKSVLDLQVVADAMSAFDPASTDPLLNKAIQQFNFTAIANSFDTARGANATFMHWSALNTLLPAHLSGSDSAAFGGDLAHQYGKNGTLTGMNLAAAQSVINDPLFGAQVQTLHPLQGLQGGAVSLG